MSAAALAWLAAGLRYAAAVVRGVAWYLVAAAVGVALVTAVVPAGSRSSAGVKAAVHFDQQLLEALTGVALAPPPGVEDGVALAASTWAARPSLSTPVVTAPAAGWDIGLSTDGPILRAAAGLVDVWVMLLAALSLVLFAAAAAGALRASATGSGRAAAAAFAITSAALLTALGAGDASLFHDRAAYVGWGRGVLFTAVFAGVLLVAVVRASVTDSASSVDFLGAVRGRPRRGLAGRLAAARVGVLLRPQVPVLVVVATFARTKEAIAASGIDQNELGLLILATISGADPVARAANGLALVAAMGLLTWLAGRFLVEVDRLLLPARGVRR